uniref:Uncharacterized protein n=1 Tax=Oryza glumipatula TaxID=40148 RepID=A0A0D9ZI23_9ORYZ
MGATVRDDEDCGGSERGEAGTTAASSPISLAPPTSFPRSLASRAHHPLFACPHRLQRRDPPLLPQLVRWPPSSSPMVRPGRAPVEAVAAEEAVVGSGASFGQAQRRHHRQWRLRPRAASVDGWRKADGAEDDG